MQTTYKKICQFVHKEYGEDMANELRSNEQRQTLLTGCSDARVRPNYLITRHNARVTAIEASRVRLRLAREADLAVMQSDPDTPQVDIAKLQNELARLQSLVVEANEPNNVHLPTVG